jgi:hypothetical protein
VSQSCNQDCTNVGGRQQTQQNLSLQWGERQRLIAAGGVREGTYTVRNAVTDYLAEIRPKRSRPP